MKTKGIRIRDKTESSISSSLLEILNEIPGGDNYIWAIEYIEAISDYKKEKKPPINEKEVNETPNGLLISWNRLIKISSEFFQIYDLVLIGCKDINKIKRYEDDQEMYETCDIVIVMFDCAFWEVFSKDKRLINRLALKFKRTELIDSDFQKSFKM